MNSVIRGVLWGLLIEAGSAFLVILAVWALK